MVSNTFLEPSMKDYITIWHISLCIKEGPDKKIVLAEIFVDDTLFTRNDDLCKAFLEQMNKEFEMSMFGERKFFVGLQIHQSKNGISITQFKYIK